MKPPDYLKMLIVEDDLLMGQVIQDYFSNRPYEFLIARDGEEGFVQAIKELPDIIIMDLILPKMGGVELIKTLRKRPEFAVTPIVAVTAGSPVVQEAARQAGAHIVLVKPFTQEQLIEQVDTLVLSTPFIRKR